LAGSLALMWRPVRRWSHLVRLVILATPTLILLVPAVDTFFQMAQPRPGNPDSQIVEVIAIAVALAVLAGTLVVSVGITRVRPLAGTST
jgi:hypothetical protein